jgi:hypothetical protein
MLVLARDDRSNHTSARPYTAPTTAPRAGERDGKDQDGLQAEAAARGGLETGEDDDHPECPS